MKNWASMESTHHCHETLVIVVPLPAQGHLNQLLHLSRILALRGLGVLYVAPSTHIQQVRHRVQGWASHDFDIRFQEFPMPDFLGGEPNPESSRKFPEHFMPLFEAFEEQLPPHLDHLLSTVCSSNDKRVVVVHDSTAGFVQTVAAKHEIPAYVFRPIGVYSSVSLRQPQDGTADSSPFNVSLTRRAPERWWKFIARQRSLLGPAKGYILNSFYALESEFINRARERLASGGKPVWTVGPLLPQEFLDNGQGLKLPTDSEYLTWLDTQAPASVLYVSFGSVSSLSASEVRELAAGLERSGQPFLWVLRISDSARFSTESRSEWIQKCLPEGYERRIEGRGVIVRDWAPQLQVLSHKSTGGFLTHCGWNSTLESITAGVPMVAWPLHSDQFGNSMLIVRELKVGVEVKEWRNAEKHEIVSAEEVEKAVKRLMLDEEGTQIRKRSQELRSEARKAVAEGGSSWRDLISLVHDISQPLLRQDKESAEAAMSHF
uniref:Glycosyltransferase n=1 Tax=Wollemia nobilis TaxID=56998 RepID=A0A0C9RJQ7_9CONI